MDILLLDDDSACLDGLVTLLEPAGHRCDVFRVPEEAIKAYGKNQYDVVITDMRMPGMNGIDVLQKVLSLNNVARVVLTAGYLDVETAIAAINNRAYALFVKPIDVPNFMDTLCQIEREVEEEKKNRAEQVRMAEELSRLRRAYDDLTSLIKPVDQTPVRGSRN